MACYVESNSSLDTARSEEPRSPATPGAAPTLLVKRRAGQRAWGGALARFVATRLWREGFPIVDLSFCDIGNLHV